MKTEAKDLQSALIEASKILECSVMDLEYEILQQPKSGFLGFGRKNAIIEVNVKKRFKKNSKKDFSPSKHFEKLENKFEEKLSKKDFKSEFKPSEKTNNTELKPSFNKERYSAKNDEIFDSFYKEGKGSRNHEDILDEIRIGLEGLLKASWFEIELVELKMYNEDCVFIKLDGKDAALMIGKEAHRYKAISYLLHNWINLKYNLLVRLEIAQFLENQIQGMKIYLQSVIERIKINGRGQTKPLDGVLIKIALEELRKEFPNKYVGIKQLGEQRIVVINDFLKKDE
ncbi:MAG: Jag N-terminal domain-containing protein [Campylobacter sp.]|nr:Jag N-terminal domain-containing protein [Campylobacter sp.]